MSREAEVPRSEVALTLGLLVQGFVALPATVVVALLVWLQAHHPQREYDDALFSVVWFASFLLPGLLLHATATASLSWLRHGRPRDRRPILVDAALGAVLGGVMALVYVALDVLNVRSREAIGPLDLWVTSVVTGLLTGGGLGGGAGLGARWLSRRAGRSYRRARRRALAVLNSALVYVGAIPCVAFVFVAAQSSFERWDGMDSIVAPLVILYFCVIVAALAIPHAVLVGVFAVFQRTLLGARASPILDAMVSLFLGVILAMLALALIDDGIRWYHHPSTLAVALLTHAAFCVLSGALFGVGWESASRSAAS